MTTVDELVTELHEMRQRIERLEASPLNSPDIEAAKSLLSGGFPRQRIHWSQEISQTDRLAVLATLSIWALFLKDGTGEWQWRVAVASGLSALVIGLWRWQARHLDDGIAALYAPIMHYENALRISAENSLLRGLRRTHNSPEKVAQLVRDKRIGTRGHLAFDWVAVIAILAMAAITLIAGWSESISCCAWGNPLHPYALLLLNVLGMLLVIWAMNAYQTNKGGIRALWRKGEHTRPAGESDASNQGIA
jgi:hypothetical protein